MTVILEELIYKRLTGSEELAGWLAVYEGRSAVFSPDPPEDSQDGWEGSRQYPRVLYSFDLQANSERRSAGTLAVSLLCQNTEDVNPERIEPAVTGCLRDVILNPKGGTPYCFAWARTDPFTVDDKGRLLIGSEIRFDILEYPSQETTDPDPVMATGIYVKKMYPECLVMGYDRMDEITEASAERPVVFCRLVSAEKADETNTVAWMNGRIAIHILCPDSAKRQKMVADISNSISLDGEIILPDYSPMFIRGLQTDYRADYLKNGQILLTGRYGLLRYRPKPHMLTGNNISYKEGDR